MDIEKVREAFLEMPEAEECTPFGDDVLVFKNNQGKIFGLLSLGGSFVASMKCDPDRAIELREEYPDVVVPGYHLNKKHWNSIYFERFPDSLFIELIQHSFDLVTKKKKK